jgi:hypothetical protein
MDTKLNIHEIEYAIAKDRRFNFLKNDVLINISWGFLYHEADMLIVSKTGYISEIEIKRSIADLRNDFTKKNHTHSSQLINKFYYAVPEKLVEKTKLLLLEHKRVAGIISYSENKKINIIIEAPNLKKRKITLEERVKLLRLGNMRVWRMHKYFEKLENNDTKI